MPTFRHLISYIKIYKLSRKPLYILCLMILFWALYEGIVSYIAPIVITEGGLSKTMMGIIIGSSSVAGALFDFIACRVFKNANYKRIFLIMFILCLVYPLILFKANTFVIYLIAMVIWGIYYDLKNIASFDYVGRYTEKSEHSASFGIIQVFQSIGFLIAPIITGIVIADYLDWKPFVMAWIFLVISILFFIVLSFISKKQDVLTEDKKDISQLSTLSEMRIWSKIGKVILPVLILTFFLNFIDAFFWTVGPIFAESLQGAHQFAGFFMVAYSLPALIVGWFIGSLTRRYGKKMTAFVTLLIGSILLSTIILLGNSFLTILVVFLSSIFISMAWPAINGAYADYISETLGYEKEIEGLEDFYTNLGYIFGPALAGFLADKLGNSGAFSTLGLLGFITAIILIIITPRKINVIKSIS